MVERNSELWSESLRGHLENNQPPGVSDTSRELIDDIAFCDENVARSEPGIRRLSWSDSHVYFFAGVRRRETRHRCATTEKVPSQSIVIDDSWCAELGRENSSVWIAATPTGPWDKGKDTWIGGVKHSCER